MCSFLDLDVIEIYWLSRRCVDFSRTAEVDLHRRLLSYSYILISPDLLFVFISSTPVGVSGKGRLVNLAQRYKSQAELFRGRIEKLMVEDL